MGDGGAQGLSVEYAAFCEAFGRREAGAQRSLCSSLLTAESESNETQEFFVTHVWGTSDIFRRIFRPIFRG